jgi:hypothetical protein
VRVRLDEGLHFIVTEQVGGVASERDPVFLGNICLEGFDDQTNLDASIGGENISAVDAVHLERPVRDDDDLTLQVSNVDVRVLPLEVVNGLLREVACDVEVVVGHEEMREALLHEAFDLLLWNVIGQLGEVATVLHHLTVKLLECRLLVWVGHLKQ